MNITFFSEGIDFKLPHPRKTQAWLKAVITKEKKKLNALSYIFCTDSFLLGINQAFLKHNTLTDIITFDYSKKGQLEGEIYISIERVIENSKTFDQPFEDELHRVIVHGVLHLAGYNDKNPSQKALMRKKEEAYLSLRS